MSFSLPDGTQIWTLENRILQHAYEFGAKNRMTRAVDGMGNIAEYHYNGLGHRIGVRQGVIGCPVSQGLSGHRTEGTPDFGADNVVPQTPEVWNKETAYILDFTRNYHNLLQKEARGNVQSYIWDSEVLFMEENGECYSYLNDMQGSAMRLLNHGGEDVISYRYDEFGTDLSGNQGQFQPFGYTGYQRDTIAGTYYAQAREYDAWSGRFTGEDVVKGSVTYPETLNAYGYCWGNPVNYVDRDGEFPTKNDIEETIKEAYEKAEEWAVNNVDVKKSVTMTTRENFGIVGHYEKVTVSEKGNNKKYNVTLDNASLISGSVSLNYNIGGIDINGNVGISGSGPQTSYSYTWTGKDDKIHSIKVKTDLKSVGIEWKSDKELYGSGIRINMGKFSTSEIYTFRTDDTKEATIRREEGSYLNNQTLALAVVAVVVSIPELASIFGSVSVAVAGLTMCILIANLYKEQLKYKDDCEV